MVSGGVAPDPSKAEGATAFLARIGRCGGALWALIGFGILLRAAQYVADPSLWLDEAMLALNLVGRTAAGLRGPLAYEQAAPYLFLILERKVLDILGTGEMALRLLPFLASCASLPLGLVVSRRMLPPAGVAVAVALLAVSDPLIDYAAQVKPYAVDAAVALLILAATLKIRAGEGRRVWTLLLGALGLFSPWLSFPSPFVFGPALAILLAARRPGTRAGVLGAGGLWAGSLIGLALYTAGWESAGALRGVWSATGGFPPAPPRSVEDLLWYPKAAVDVLRMPGGITIPGVGVVLSLWGAVAMAARREWASWTLAAGPLLLALAASALHLYPFSGRLLLFAAPGLTVLVARGLLEASRTGGRRLATALLLVALLLTIGVEAGRAAYHVARPRVREEVRDLVGILEDAGLADDIVYVYYGAGPTFDYYAPDPDFCVLYGIKARGEPELYLEELDALAGERRVWILLSHVYDWRRLDEGAWILDHLDARFARLETHEAAGGGLYLYDLGIRDR